MARGTTDGSRHGGPMRITSFTTEPRAIHKILTHLGIPSRCHTDSLPTATGRVSLEWLLCGAVRPRLRGAADGGLQVDGPTNPSEDATVTRAEEPPIHWDVAVPLVNNLEMVWTLARVLLIAGMGLVLVLTIALGTSGEWKALGGLIIGVGLAVAGLLALGLAIMVVLWPRGMRVSYTVDEDGIRFAIRSGVARAIPPIAVAAGTMLGSGRLVGMGLVNAGQQEQRLRWKGRFRAHLDARRMRIRLANGWRTLMVLYCTRENYGTVAERVKAEMARHRTAERASGRSPLLGYLSRTLLVVLACLPIFALGTRYDIGLLLPILLVCFALATVWLVPLFGWVVLGGLGVTLGSLTLELVAVRRSSIFPGRSFRRLDLLAGDDFALLALAAAGVAYLVMLSVKALRGRLPVALATDHADMGE